MQIVMSARFRSSILIMFISALVACTTQLAPLYDKALMEGLTSVNADTMELFASVAGGTTSQTFPKREAQYNKTIGRLDALSLQSAARAVPKNNVLEAVMKVFGSRNKPMPNPVVPSATALAEISKAISEMREADKSTGLSDLQISDARGRTLVYMDQALTYEAELER